MDVFEAVQTLLAVREYEDRPVPGEIIDRVVEAGRLTASAMNKQPWHFVVVDDRETLRQLGTAAPTGPYIGGCAFAVAVAVARDSVWGQSDASRAVQSMALTAWAAGVGSNWVGFGKLEAAAGILAIPESSELFVIVPFGYPVKSIGSGKKARKPLAAVASRNRFETPFQ